jgi:hypothetical protein
VPAVSRPLDEDAGAEVGDCPVHRAGAIGGREGCAVGDFGRHRDVATDEFRPQNTPVAATSTLHFSISSIR